MLFAGRRDPTQRRKGGKVAKLNPMISQLRLLSFFLMAALLSPLLTFNQPVLAKDRDVRPYTAIASKDAIKWADKQLSKMSLEEKVGQLIAVGVNASFLNQDSEAFRALRHQVVDNHIGGIILFKGPVYESVVRSEERRVGKRCRSR